ncbi:MAG: hypothetical protein ABI638_04350 [Ignavibacteriota bacterium]
MSRCEVCNTELAQDEIRYAHSTILCADCFDDGYTYCSRCDSVITRSEAIYDDCGDAYCQSCYDENHDDNCPDNPEVNELDRQLIVHLSRNWLQGKVDNRKPLEINQNDHTLVKLRKQIGLVDKSLYCYGLVNREEYQITASFDLMDEVKKYLADRKLQLNVQFVAGTRRLGISDDLRTNNPNTTLDLLKALTSNTDTAASAA